MSTRSIRVHIIRSDGVEEHRNMPYGDVADAIGAPNGLDTVNLRDGRIMCVDDNGWETQSVESPALVQGQPGTRISLIPTKARRPVNPKATALYHSVCRPGTTHQIVGDVAIVWDEDFE